MNNYFDKFKKFEGHALKQSIQNDIFSQSSIKDLCGGENDTHIKFVLVFFHSYTVEKIQM